MFSVAFRNEYVEYLTHMTSIMEVYTPLATCVVKFIKNDIHFPLWMQGDMGRAYVCLATVS
jgi:hypothetical protein